MKSTLFLLMLFLSFGSSGAIRLYPGPHQRAMTGTEHDARWAAGMGSHRSTKDATARRTFRPEDGYHRFIRAVKTFRTGGVLLLAGAGMLGLMLLFSESVSLPLTALLSLLTVAGIALVAGGLLVIFGLIGYLVYKKHRLPGR